MIHNFPILLLLVLLSACTQNVPDDGVITDRGIFPSPSGSSHLIIEYKSKSLVDYKIVDITTRKEFAPDKPFSNAMRWAAFWQDDDTLWVHSSDIGLSVWKRDSDGIFTQEWPGERTELVHSIPDDLWEFIPSSIKRQWESLHDHDSEPDGENP